MFRRKFPYYKQFDASDCGPTCLKMIVRHYGRDISLQSLRDISHIEREGVSILALKKAAKDIGFEAEAVKLTITKPNPPSLDIREVPTPFILFWDERHFVIVYKVKGGLCWIADPGKGRVVLPLVEVEHHALGTREYAKAVLIEPTPQFYAEENAFFSNQGWKLKLEYLRKHLGPNRKLFWILFGVLFLQLGLQSVSPFLTQLSFDSGILNKDLGILVYVLLIQSGIFLFTSGVSFVQSVLANRLSQGINFSLSKDFIRKIFGLPVAFFAQKQRSDFLNRVSDLNRIESFLAHNFSSLMLAGLGFLVLSGLALYYDGITYSIFIGYQVLYGVWVAYAIRKRRELDYERYDIGVHKHRHLMEMIEGVQEVKLTGDEEPKIQALLDNQRRHFKNELRNIRIQQTLTTGGGLIKNLGYGFITFYTAQLAVNEVLSIGQMAAIQLVIGQLNTMASTLFSSATQVQEIRFSLERILEIQQIPDEVTGELPIPQSAAITMRDVNFSYSPLSPLVLKGVDLDLAFNKTTAIVGHSGSGKTTLMKLALGLLDPSHGSITLDGKAIPEHDIRAWRRRCGVVMQEGFIFTDTIFHNVTGSDPNPDFERYLDSLKLACLYDFVMELPIRHDTKIGRDGLSLSSGQQQRMLLARLFYKDPDYIFMDEATNSLDSQTEKFILDNLEDRFANKTRVVIAHRLNTVRYADNIVVVDKGQIVEQGSHEALVALEGQYFALVKEQLQLH